MPSSWSNISNLPIGDHEVAIFYEVDGIDAMAGPSVSFGEIADCEAIKCLPSDQREALAGRYAKDRLWRQVLPGTGGRTGIAIGEDLYPHIRDILSGARLDLATRWLPTDNARRLLASADLYSEKIPPLKRFKKTIVLQHAQAAVQRLATFGIAPRKLKLTLDVLDLILFSTRKGFVQARASFTAAEDDGPLCALELLEAIYAISRFNRFTWVSAGSRSAVAGAGFTLETLIRSLCLGKSGETRPSGRVYTYLLTRFDTAISIADSLISSASMRRVTTRLIMLSDDVASVRRVRDFVTVRHTVSLEGAAADSDEAARV